MPIPKPKLTIIKMRTKPNMDIDGYLFIKGFKLLGRYGEYYIYARLGTLGNEIYPMEEELKRRKKNINYTIQEIEIELRGEDERKKH